MKQWTSMSLLAITLAACGPGGDAGQDASAGVDFGPSGVDVTGRFASMLSIKLEGTDAGATASWQLPLTWIAYQHAGSKDIHVDTTWLVCDIPVPGLIDIPYKVLDPVRPRFSTGILASRDDGARYTQPNISILVGAQLANPDTDPLPVDGSHLCASASDTGCVQPDFSGKPGVALEAHGFSPDIDLLWIDVRLQFAFDGAARLDGTLHGDVTSAGLETHVLGCRLRADGSLCAPDVVARFEASHPRVTLGTGTLRSHAQGSYFTCPQFLNDPLNAVEGTELPDAGTDDIKTGGMSFASDIQADIDARGCATGGCHETFTAPGQMHLIFQPASDAERQQNWRAVLPFTTGAGGPGGRFVNQVPIPVEMKDRWLSWISQGAPY